MSNRIKFHLDEQVKSVIARELRRRGIDVTTTVEVGLRTQSDEAQLAFICQEKRVLFTQVIFSEWQVVPVFIRVLLIVNKAVVLLERLWKV